MVSGAHSHKRSSAGTSVPELLTAMVGFQALSIHGNFSEGAFHARSVLETITHSTDSHSLYEFMQQKEVQCARLLNVDLPESLPNAVQFLETKLQEVMGVHKALILLLDEDSGTYSCLNDEAHPEQLPREITCIADRFLQDLLGSAEVLHADLMQNGTAIGIVALADKQDKTAFSIYDALSLEVLAPYLTTKILSVQHIKRSHSIPFTQNVLLDLSTRFIGALDCPSVLRATLDTLSGHLGFHDSQFVALDTKTGEGTTPLETTETVLPSYASLTSLFSSLAQKRPYLSFSGKRLGDKSLEEIFHRTPIESVWMLPLLDAQTGAVRGTFNFFHHTPMRLPEEAATIAAQAVPLIASAWERACMLEKTLALATRDELTGALNRRGFYHRFEAEVERARRQKSPVCLAMLDVDFFKSINDRYGHQVGDEVLYELTRVILANSRKTDIFCRFGGEEFTLLMPDTPLQAAIDLMERLRQSIAGTALQTSVGPITITVSVGLTPITVETETSTAPMEIISKALSVVDRHLYTAKHSGRNQLCAETD